MAAPLCAGRGRGAGGCAAQRTTAQGPPGWADRGCPGQSVAALLGARPDLLERLPAHRLRGPALSPAALLCNGPAPVAPDGLALGTPTTGPCPQARPAGGNKARGAGLGSDRGGAGPGPSAVSGRVGPAALAPHPGHVDERAAGAGAHPWHQPPSRLFRGLGCRERTLVFVDHDRKLAVHFVALLQRLAAAYPTGPLYLALDQAPAHTAKVVQAWLKTHPRATLLWLPKYAAHETNPVERIWGLMKSAVAADRLAGSIEDLTAAARRFFTDLAPHPVKLPIAA